MSVMTVQGESKTKSTIQRFDVLRVFLGIGLLVTAGLKAHGLVLDPVSQDSFLSSPRLQVAVIEIEILLGLWLLSGFAKRGAWWCALVFFGALAAASFYLGWEGQASCGCFGRVAVSPWVTFVFDIGVVAALALCRPVEPSERRGRARLFCVAKITAAATLLAVVVVGSFWLIAENPTAALARLRGEPILVSPAISDVGDGKVGESRRFRIDLANFTDQEIRIVGGTSNCSCVATRDLPITISPGERRSIDIVMRFTGRPGIFQHRFVLFTDCDQHRYVVARFGGRVIESPSSNGNNLARQ